MPSIHRLVNQYRNISWNNLLYARSWRLSLARVNKASRFIKDLKRVISPQQRATIYETKFQRNYPIRRTRAPQPAIDANLIQPARSEALGGPVKTFSSVHGTYVRTYVDPSRQDRGERANSLLVSVDHAHTHARAYTTVPSGWNEGSARIRTKVASGQRRIPNERVSALRMTVACRT